ncbi:bis-aminopropyl spermidine synthase family protein [Saccharopolyspora sp. CA-218241]|uniref:bis-aminopropyl spermidine synthase family protein n=1 Tax=Saccharopolyspora sp. CA-218241 TaxID=3240027 RepID=UPI003D9A0871
MNTTSLDAVDALLDDAGVHSRPLREVLALLAAGPLPFDELVRRSALPRRTVEDLLAALGPDLDRDADGCRLVPAVRAEYRSRLAPPAAEPDAEVAALLRRFIATGPAPLAALDHVTATPETVLRRAEWLRDHYDLTGARLLFLGDHDLTSTAVALLAPEASITVVDVDERILRHLDALSAEHRLGVRTLHADLRFGLPPAVRAGADLVFTDPPYTPEGIGLFAGRAAEAMAGPGSRLLLAYGFSPRTPALGLKVQQELLRLGMVFEAVLPGFHRYEGAQAIGSAADLYVCQPTGKARKKGARGQAIYTHGPQAVESAGGPAPLEALGALLGTPVTALRGPDWTAPVSAAAVFDLRADPGPWLARMLLACSADRVAFLLPNQHPDLADERGQRALADLVAGKYALRLHRSAPDPAHAVVVAEAVTDDSAAGGLLRRAHGKLGNVWREALIATGGGTKREAADRVAALVPDPEDLALRLIDLPRHRIAELLTAARTA